MCANAEIIQFVAPDLSLPEGFGMQEYGDVIILPTRDRAARLILFCIVESPEFPAKTQGWVRSLDGRDEWTAANQWWIHNKEAVLAKRYQDATWLPPAPTPPAPPK
jgi:hypothetical protein